ncbi:MAG TPA: hypothetical protein DDY98_07345, partial [Ruminococcaceae bacterium]|nr:hypothetical protein [Oscillospiraceae bacterium]
MKKTKLIRLIIVAVLLASVLAGTVVFVAKKNDKRYEAIIMTAETGSITQTLSTTGTVESLNKSDLQIFAGVVPKQVCVKAGDRVVKGQLLATFDTASLNGVLTQQQSDYNTAKLSYLNSVQSAEEASAKLPEIIAQIEQLEKTVAQLEKTQSSEDGTAKAVPTWVDSLDFGKLSGLLGNTYTEEQLRTFFGKLASKGASKTALTSLIDNMTTLNSFDFSSMLGLSEADTALVSAKVNLIGLKAQKTLLETQQKNLLGSTYKSIMDSAQTRLTEAENSVEKLKKGWYAEGDGVISAMNLVAGQPYKSTATQSSFDLSTLLSGLTSSSGSVDLSSILASISGSNNAGTGMTVEYYDSFVASFSLGKYDVLDVKVGQKCVVNAIGHELEGEVCFISPVATASSGLDVGNIISSMAGSSSGGSNSIPAQVSIKNPDESVIIGIDVDIDIEIDTVDNA